MKTAKKGLIGWLKNLISEKPKEPMHMRAESAEERIQSSQQSAAEIERVFRQLQIGDQQERSRFLVPSMEKPDSPNGARYIGTLSGNSAELPIY